MKEICMNCIGLMAHYEESPRPGVLERMESTIEAVQTMEPCKEKVCIPLIEVKKLLNERKREYKQGRLL